MDFYKYVRHTMRVGQGRFEVLEAGDTALVIMESTLDYVDPNGAPVHALRRATYVFKRAAGGSWLCAIDNSYGTALLDAWAGAGAITASPAPPRSARDR
jgi:ketosteroid isomerase-like protein